MILMKYSFICDQGHEPQTFTVEADNDEGAVVNLMEQTQPHLAQVHPEMAGGSPEDAKQMIMSAWTKE